MLTVMRGSSFGIPIETFMALATKPLNLKYDTTSETYLLDSLIEPSTQTEDQLLDQLFTKREQSFDSIALQKEVIEARCNPP